MNRPLVFQARTAADRAAIQAAAEALRRGALAVIPTDTVYGLAGDPRAPGVLDRLFEAKGRDRNKPIPFLVAGLDAVAACGAELNGIEQRLARRFWPGPLTLVLNVGSWTEGFRVPNHEVALALLREVGGSLRATSANLSGEPPALTADDARRALGAAVDAILDGGPVQGGAPSTVVKVEQGTIRILRSGAISEAELRIS
ncbi:MAG: L-threonylcarbamoyladenylate synthase [Verrucomicrobiota bacterium]|nr:L-threonylcarbamoyladenylate synthase [Verrucomicrobiota bacterium]